MENEFIKRLRTLTNLIEEAEAIKQSMEVAIKEADQAGQMKVLHRLTMDHPGMKNWAETYSKIFNLM